MDMLEHKYGGKRWEMSILLFELDNLANVRDGEAQDMEEFTEAVQTAYLS